MRDRYDLAVVGAGIVGLACALAAARRGLRVIVMERDARAQKASVRNFGLITVTGQDREAVWNRARRSLDVWKEVTTKAGIPLMQRGLWAVAQRPESAAVLEAFMRTDMAEGCELLTSTIARQRCPEMNPAGLQSVLWSPHELRVESRDAIPALTSWLAREFSVTFCWETAVHAVAPPRIETARGPILAGAAAVCPGDDLTSLFPAQLAGVGRCTLQMLRLDNPGFALPATVMSDLSLIRYGGFSNLAETTPLRQRLASEQSELLEHGIHLIIAQGGDGSLVVGDSHHYDSTEAVFATERVYELILEEYTKVTGRAPPAIRQRWIGTYADADTGSVLLATPAANIRLVVVTSGIGASIGFAIGEEVVGELFN